MNFTFQLALGTNAVEITKENHLEKNEGINGWTAVILAVKMANLFINKREVDILIDLAKHVVHRHEVFDRYQFIVLLFISIRTQH
ncbi:hypothetical protein D3C84_1181530 [compost metagenome]